MAGKKKWRKETKRNLKERKWTGGKTPSPALTLWQKYQLFIARVHFYSVLPVCGLILLGCLGDLNIRKTTHHLAAFKAVNHFLGSHEGCSRLRTKGLWRKFWTGPYLPTRRNSPYTPSLLMAIRRPRTVMPSQKHTTTRALGSRSRSFLKRRS